MNLVILPPFYYGAASYAVAPPEGNGSLHVNAEKLIPFAQEMFGGLLRIGFRNIHVIVHHQTENFVAGMPTDLAFKFAARQAIFAFLEKERGEGWWGSEKMADYYARAIVRRRSVQLDQGAPADDAGSDGRLSIRSRRTGRDVAADGAMSRGGRSGVFVGQDMVRAQRRGASSRELGVRGPRAYPRSLAESFARRPISDQRRQTAVGVALAGPKQVD